MVSFQCDGCSDVVKKPKLDQHGARCHAPFTCIDCSKTFRSPAEWKGHTTCISEAEKYQKALYKGPKGKQNNGPGKFGNQPRTPGPGEYYGDNSGRGNRPRGAATGANTTPLATPTRMSPVSTPPPVAAPDPTPQKGDGVEVVNGVDEKKKKDKKRKSAVVDETLKSTEVRGNDDERPAKKAKTSANGVGKQAEVDPVTIPLLPSPEKDAVVSKKDKKDKKGKDKKKGKSEIRETKNGEEGKQVKERTEGSEKEKKQKRKLKSEIEDVEEKKVKTEALKAADVVPAGADQSREAKRTKMEKKKKPKSEVDGVSGGAEGDKKRKKGESEAAGEVEKKKKKRPKLVEA